MPQRDFRWVRSERAGLALGGNVTSGAPLGEGDLMAIVKVTIPNDRMQRSLNWNRAILLSTAIITVFMR